MTKTIKTPVVIITIVAILFVGFSLLRPRKPSPPSSSPGSLIALPSPPSWKDVVPGQDTKDTVIQKLGQPKSSQAISGADKEVLLYPSIANRWENQIYMENDSVYLIKEKFTDFPEGELDKYIEKYGTADEIIPGEHTPAAFLFVWVNHGIAAQASPTTKIVLETWYFVPSDLSSFKSHLSSEISAPSPEVQ